MRCDAAIDALSGADGVLVDDLVRYHLGQCTDCGVEESVYRRLRDALAGLADRSVPVDGKLLDDILAALDRCDERTARPNRAAACLGGLAAAGALVYAGGRRHGLFG